MPGPALNPQQALALSNILRESNFELVPLKDVTKRAVSLPAGAQVSVTASPTKPLDNHHRPS